VANSSQRNAERAAMKSMTLSSEHRSKINDEKEKNK
jgi:hypothetical protein